MPQSMLVPPRAVWVWVGGWGGGGGRRLDHPRPTGLRIRHEMSDQKAGNSTYM